MSVCLIKGLLENAMCDCIPPPLSFIGGVLMLILMLLYISNSKMGFDGWLHFSNAIKKNGKPYF